MSKPEESRQSSPSSATTPQPASASAPSSAGASQPPKAYPLSSPGGASYTGPPPNAVLIKVSKSITAVPPSTLNAPLSGPPAPASIPAQCWYANPFNLSTNTPMTEFHRSMRGKVFFSPRAVPVTASELLSLPGERPPQLTVCEVGKDLIYGMGYLYNTPLSVEHQWRGRVAHLLRVRSRQAPIPRIVCRRAEAMVAAAALQKQQQQQSKQQFNRSGEVSKSHSPSPQTNKPPVTIDYFHTMCYERGEASVYDRPGDDLLIGIKVYVNNELVEDHYPIINALPQCTTTLAVKEAAQHWNCVPFVLMGYLNQLMLDPVCIYHSLSLNFVEHLLRVKLPESAAPAKGLAAPEPQSKTAPAPSSKKKPSVSIELPLRLEVVYGCRAEAYFCTDFISRGSCTLRMTESSKRALKNYEEKLRALVRLRRAAPQLISRDLGRGGVSNISTSTSNSNGFNDSASSLPPPPPPRNCNSCGYPLQYRCTVCGADVCGMPMCVTSAVVGYPRACTRHTLLPNSAELLSLLKAQ